MDLVSTIIKDYCSIYDKYNEDYLDNIMFNFYQNDGRRIDPNKRPDIWFSVSVSLKDKLNGQFHQ